MRLFAALYPGVAACDHLDLALGAVRAFEPSRPDGAPLVRWTPRDLWHVTLAFYGEVPDGAVPDLVDGLADAARGTASLDLALRGAGVFDHRVLWVGVGGERSSVDRLRALSAAAAECGADAGARLDRRPRQRAHLTVARAAAGARQAERRAARRRREQDEGPTLRDALQGPAAALAVYDGPRWTADRLVLVASDLGDGRPVHREVASVPLVGTLHE
ncbi:RNA 2',3'-cyclic phosphodiesterase [Cellulosimicrobium marinum]|uniref:RNA 2',3'-cyclic phosphodiesterase n=1 Tax=Cellulosimicrobium marinum TaxID=1638992 RepID=UPI001E44284E|nr:RNA 2',3'-cyclic phosphodiesterase [Cellulosimicrobium marinum]MCB7137822.1 RNA 2',3'-cyclic phosphodiesterase [Cellulosimicrobium marinum]